jgi:ADP-L-glycero-D-manno-heptose 6-epimerase
MIIVTGAAGFIGSCLIQRLNELNFNYIIAVDDFSFEEKNKNLINKKIKARVERTEFMSWLDSNYQEVEFIFHIEPWADESGQWKHETNPWQ